jgi:hypothetical protein
LPRRVFKLLKVSFKWLVPPRCKARLFSVHDKWSNSRTIGRWFLLFSCLKSWNKYENYIYDSFLSMIPYSRESFLAMYLMSTLVYESIILNKFFYNKLSYKTLVWLFTTSSPLISVLNFLKTPDKATIDEAKWASETYFIAWMWLSVEYFNPNLPFSKVFTSYLLLFMILQRIIYLKQFTALESWSPIKGYRAS